MALELHDQAKENDIYDTAPSLPSNLIAASGYQLKDGVDLEDVQAWRRVIKRSMGRCVARLQRGRGGIASDPVI